MSITISQDHYLLQLRPIIDDNPAASDDTTASENMHAAFLSLLGGMAWVVQTRGDICCFVGMLQRAAKQPLPFGTCDCVSLAPRRPGTRGKRR